MAKEPGTSRVRNFVVIHPGTNDCECLAYDDYNGLGTSSGGGDPNTHAPLVATGTTGVTWHSHEAPLRHSTLYVIVENENITWKPLSRLDLKTRYTVQHGARVRKIGRIDAQSLSDLEEAA